MKFNKNRTVIDHTCIHDNLMRFIILFCGLISCSQACAEQSGHGGFEFSCASWESIEGSPIYYLSGKRPHNEDKKDRIKRLKKIDLTVMTRSQNYEFKEGRKIQFYRKITDSKGEQVLQVIATNTVPEGWKKVLFVFFPNIKKETYSVYALRDDRSHAPYGAYQFVNLSTIPVNGFLDNKKILVQPKRSLIIKLEGDASRPANFGVWSQEQGKRKWLLRNTLTYKPNKYLVYFFYEDQDRQGRMKLLSKGIVAFRPPPEKSGANTP